MSYKFKVGEIAIALGRAVPVECEIIKVDVLLYDGSRPSEVRYEIYVPSLPGPRNGNWTIGESYLRKKKPPKKKRELDTPVSWKDCLWQPQSVKAKEEV